MPPLPETPSGWLGSSERSEALKLAAARGLAARATGLMDGGMNAELKASFERTTQQVARFLNAPVGLFSMLDGECQVVIAVTAPVGVPEILPAEGSMCVHVRDSGRDVIVDDLTRHELLDLADNMTAVGANAYMGTPVFSPDGQPIGSLCAIDFPSRNWEPSDLDLLRSLAEGLTDKIALLESKTLAEASEARLAATIEAIPNVVFVFEPDGRIGYVSPQAQSQFGVAPEEFLGFGYLRHLHPEDAEDLVAGMRVRTQEPAEFEEEFRLRDAGGRYREVLATGKPFRDADGETGYIVSTTEIGRLRQVQRDLTTERGKLEAVLEALPHVVMLSSPDRGVEYVSPQSRAILGFEPEALLGFGLYDQVIHPEDRETLRAKRLAWLGNPEAFEHEFRAIHAQGHELPMLLRGFPLPSRPGVLHSHVVTFTALDAIRAAEAKVEEERRASDERIRTMLNALPILTGLVDTEGRLLYVNQIALDAGGVKLEDVIGEVLWKSKWFDDEPDDTAAREVERILTLGARGESVRTSVTFHWPIGTIETDYHVAPIFNGEGGVVSIALSVIDVTERNVARRQVEAEGVELRQVLDHSPLMKSLLDPEGRVRYMNEIPLRTFGLRLEDVVGRPIWEVAEVLGPEAPANFRQFYEQCLQGGVTHDGFAVDLPGGTIEIEHRMVAIRDEDGRVLSLLSTAMDVTDRNQASRAVEAERARLSTVVDILPSGVLIANADGRVTVSNPEAFALFGEQVAEGSSEAWPPGFIIEADGSETAWTRETVPLERALRGETVREARTIRIVTPGGEDRWLKCDAVPIVDAEGNQEGAVMTALDITALEIARREANRARAESFTKLERVIDSLPINVVLADRDGHLLYANEAPLQGAGLSLSDIVGQLAWETPWMPNEETARITKEEYLKAAGGEITRREFSVQMGDAIVDIDHTVVPIFDEDGEVEFLLPSSIDVTARNQALRTAEEERRRLRQIVDNLPIGLFVFDRERRILQANEEGLASFGLSLAQMEAREYPTARYIEADGQETPVDVEEAPLRRALRGESGRESRVMRLHHADTDPSEDRFLRAEAAALTDADGEIEGAVFTVANVKPLREAELALQREREAATERLTATLEGVSVFISLLDLQGRIVWCNQSALQASGFEFADVDGALYHESRWFAHDAQIRSQVENATMEAAAGHLSFTPVTVVGVGGFMDVDVTLAPVRGEDRAVRYIVASGIEVTARNAAMRQIVDARMSAERAREIAERATRAKDEFLAVLSHELRTPLTPAMLGLELLGGDLDEILPSAGNPEIAASILETMDTVRSNLDIQVRLIDDLLDVTRIAQGKLELRRTPVNVHDAATHAISIVLPKAEEKGIVVTLHPDAARSLVSADPARLRQILWNLLTNAVKFTGAGGQVRIETEDAGPQMIRIKVVDEGLGIEPERLATIFDAFDQGDGAVSRGFGGLGLGLAIARSLARAHGGTLWATSQGRGEGATFVLELPTIQVVNGLVEMETRRLVRQAHRGCRVLLVEDNLDTAKFTAELLRRVEIDVTVAHSVAEAAAQGRNGHWNAVLTDIGLPDGDGVEAVRRLRAQGVNSPAVAMSGYGRDEDKARTSDAGFRAHLVKPILFERLLEVLDEILPESYG